MNRFFHIAGLGWMAVCAAVLGLGLPPVLFLTAGAGTLLAALLLKNRYRLPLWARAAAAAFCICPAVLLFYQAAFVLPSEAENGKIHTLRGVAGECQASSLILRLDDHQLPPALRGARVRIYHASGLDVSPGDVVEYSVKLSCDPARRMALYAEGIRFEAFSNAPPIVTSHVDGAASKLEQYRGRLSSNLRRVLPLGEGEILSAMLFGKTQGISPALRQNYARAGISHLLAVSGLHLALLIGMLDSFLSLISISKRMRGILTLLAVFCMMAMAGFSYSVTRAGLMMFLCQVALLLGRDSDTLNSLGAAVVVILLLNPYAAFSVSLQLSYFATMGIAAFAEPFSNWCSKRLLRRTIWALREENKFLAAIFAAFGVTVSASILTTPFVSWYFGQISLVSPLTNLLIVPIAGAMLGCAALCAFAGLFSPLFFLSALSGFAAGVLVRAVNALAAFVSGFRYAAVPVQQPYVFLWMAAGIVLFIALWYIRAPAGALFWAGELAGCALVIGMLSHALLWGHPIELAVSQTGNTVTLLHGRQAAIVGTPANAYEAEQLAALLKDRNVTSICFLCAEEEQLLLTHASYTFFEQFPIQQQQILETSGGFEASVFGQVRILYTPVPDAPRQVQIEAGGLTIVREYGMRPAAAHILINKRGDLIFAPGITPPLCERYYGSRILTLRSNLAAGEDNR